MVGTVLVIYYKQISEGYEDRERFIILQKVGLDQKKIKQTINKQVLTVFFLPLLFAFIHLAFAYHMLSLILKVIGVNRYDYDVDCDLVYLRYLPHRLCADFHDYFKKLSQDCPNVKKIPRLQNRGISYVLNAEKLSEQEGNSHGQEANS